MRGNTILGLFFLLSAISVCGQNGERPPNIIVIFCDDLGYGDLSTYGSVWNQTPELDRMASEGVRFTNFYAGAPVCTPSRAGLLTGCYARRVDLDLDAKNNWVLFPVGKKGINPKEKILPEILKSAGYATAIFGKWHLGDQPQFLPNEHGFDYWFGLPYSNDMEREKGGNPPLPLMRNGEIVEQREQHRAFDQSTLTKRYTEEAIAWMDNHKDRPFFVYLPHTMPHNPVAARPEFYEKTNNPKSGFGAAVAEIDWSTGRIREYLKANALEDNTLVLFTSDNGGAMRRGASNGILRGGKGNVYEGGVRVPMIACWPGKIGTGGTCHQMASVIDFYPTFAKLAGIPLDLSVKRDGTDISDYLFHPQKRRADRPYYFWHVGYLRALRLGDWKLMLTGPFLKEDRGMVLYNLKEDPSETTDRSQEHPEIVARLLDMAEEQKKALGERNDYGPEVRRTVWVENPVPLIKQSK
ncbi:MAG: sulfatase [Bacteroidota bacterium]